MRDGSITHSRSSSDIPITSPAAAASPRRPSGHPGNERRDANARIAAKLPPPSFAYKRTVNTASAVDTARRIYPYSAVPPPPPLRHHSTLPSDAYPQTPPAVRPSPILLLPRLSFSPPHAPPPLTTHRTQTHPIPLSQGIHRSVYDIYTSYWILHRPLHHRRTRHHRFVQRWSAGCSSRRGWSAGRRNGEVQGGIDCSGGGCRVQQRRPEVAGGGGEFKTHRYSLQCVRARAFVQPPRPAPV